MLPAKLNFSAYGRAKAEVVTDGSINHYQEVGSPERAGKLSARTRVGIFLRA